MFDTVLTDDGLCCTFNTVADKFMYVNAPDILKPATMEGYYPVDWTPENKYGNIDLNSNFFPRIAKGIGTRMGLTVLLNTSSKEYFCTSTRSYGFKVLVHNPVEKPKIDNFGLLVTKGRETRISIKPSIQSASPSIRSIARNKRHCLFSDEGNLTYYRTYSRKNCELECESKFIYDYCKCILYYLPLIDPNASICAPSDSKCTSNVQTKLESADQNISCQNCVPACYELGYDTTITSTQLVQGNFETKTTPLTLSLRMMKMRIWL
uniref:Pickpocket protein 28 n=1 Tax=Megaselia scalaris TaxID=36166 RepID=T1GNS8_MEGSC